MNGQPRILIISHSFAPVLNPRAIRWSAIARRLTDRGYAVDVITGWLPHQRRKELVDGVQIYRPGGGVLERVRHRAGRTQATPGSDTRGTEHEFSPALQLLRNGATWALRHLHDVTWRPAYWPDYACLWIAPACRVARRLLTERSYATLITVSDPFSSHIAGLRVKRQHPSLRWIADIGDPFTFRQGTPANNETLYDRRNHRAESRIFDLADAISVTCEPTQRRYEELYPHAVGKIKTIPPMVTGESDNDSRREVFPRDDKIRMVFVGTLYPAIRNPEYLLRIFAQVAQSELKGQVELHFFGATGACQSQFDRLERDIRHAIFLHGLVAHETVMQAMRQADALVNIGNTNPYQLPSKVAEYAFSGRPIVNFVTGKNDTSANFLQGYAPLLNLTVTSQEDGTAAARLLEEFLKSVSKQSDRPDPDRWRAPFSEASITDQYESLLSPIVSSAEP